jgi:mannose-6-phosphate isomerase-like protein (cupin superfamily)
MSMPNDIAAAAPNEINQPAPAGKYLVDSYEDWAKGEGVPIHTGASIDLIAAEVKPWARFGLNGAFVHLKGRDDFLTIFINELPPNSGSSPHQHLYEEVCYVISGIGSTEFQAPDGHTQVIEWGPKSLFALPMNARYRHRNASAAPARFAAISDMRYLFNLYRSEKFIFGSTLQFAERYGGTQVVADLARHQAGPLTLAKGTISSDVVELAPGTYGQAFRQMHGAHLFGVDGDGYTLAWEEGAPDYVRTAWRHGVVIAAPGMSFRQHFNAGNQPARYLDVQLGSRQQPVFRHRRAAYGDTSVYAAGRASIPFAEQDPRIHKLWLDAIAGKGVTPRMKA